ncbi:putative glycolipid-binding domain-containing protein [Olivibacter sp. SDN3]|uniref:putative glycolipid-binding domain-containing protein n=1 Tax=Olivibacter sp. SDN3 TaxID=2764720 RepID=UPI0016513C21|nr:putative glycolipid-binding domain-containing protein [Olivibacter sp. SDN3]QNL50218.1 putative glycolipid-binding domain-containing protein [Olivibacter sp. SDN3]
MEIKRISWNGMETFNTHENLIMEILAERNAVVHSTVNGTINQMKVIVNYEVHINEKWQVNAVSINGHLDDEFISWHYLFASNRWLTDDGGKEFPLGYYDIDISVSPFTNTLAINRLMLKVGEKKTINVLYFDVLEQRVYIASQCYTRLDQQLYRFENTEGDFMAEITIDEDGFVINYPKLFKRL